MGRRYGTGSLYQRADGRWIGRLADGRGGHLHVTGTDREDVRKRLDEARRSRDRTATRSTGRGGERVSELMTRYLDTIAPLRNRPKHVHTGKAAQRDHIDPVIGRIRVTQLEVSDVQRVVDRMLGRYAPQTIHNTVRYLSVALRQAQREGTVDRNVARLAVLPSRTRDRLPTLSTADVRRFLAATKGEPLWPVWVLAATTGMRIGEVVGLLWRDVTWDGPEPVAVTVTGQWRRVRIDDETIRWDRVEPKTPRSRRTLPLTPMAREALRVQRGRTRSVKTVFTNRFGDPLDPSVAAATFHRTLLRLGFPDVRLHSLRHTAAVTLLDAMGGDIRAVSATLGHSTIGITVDTYGRDAEDARRRAAEAMARAMEDVG